MTARWGGGSGRGLPQQRRTQSTTARRHARRTRQPETKRRQSHNEKSAVGHTTQTSVRLDAGCTFSLGLAALPADVAIFTSLPTPSRSKTCFTGSLRPAHPGNPRQSSACSPGTGRSAGCRWRGKSEGKCRCRRENTLTGGRRSTLVQRSAARTKRQLTEGHLGQIVGAEREEVSHLKRSHTHTSGSREMKASILYDDLSPTLAMSSARRAARGISIMVPTRKATVSFRSANTSAATFRMRLA
jgi:hypothetical protein